jgi:toxin YoeB
MAKRTIVWTETAAKHRRQILKYWAERNQSTTFAVKLIEIIAKHLKVISKNPEALKETDFEIKLKTQNSLRCFRTF